MKEWELTIDEMRRVRDEAAYESPSGISTVEFEEWIHRAIATAAQRKFVVWVNQCANNLLISKSELLALWRDAEDALGVTRD